MANSHKLPTASRRVQDFAFVNYQPTEGGGDNLAEWIVDA
jgi:hypothetical protein